MVLGAVCNPWMEFLFPKTDFNRSWKVFGCFYERKKILRFFSQATAGLYPLYCVGSRYLLLSFSFLKDNDIAKL